MFHWKSKTWKYLFFIFFDRKRPNNGEVNVQYIKSTLFVPKWFPNWVSHSIYHNFTSCINLLQAIQSNKQKLPRMESSGQHLSSEWPRVLLRTLAIIKLEVYWKPPQCVLKQHPAFYLSLKKVVITYLLFPTTWIFSKMSWTAMGLLKMQHKELYRLCCKSNVCNMLLPDPLQTVC